MTRVAVAVLALLGGTSLAFAAGPPSYEVVKTCRIVAGTTGALAEMSYQGCMEAERRSRSDLTRRWSSIPESIRKDCLSTEEALGSSGSYSGLKSCIDGEILYAQWQKTHPNPLTTARTETPAPAQRGRRGGTIGSPADQINNPPTVGTGTIPGTGLGTPGLGTPGTPGLGTPGTGTGGTGAFGTTGTGLGPTGTGTTSTGLGTPGLGTSGTGTTGLGTSGPGTSGGTGSSLGGGTAGSGTAGAGSAGGSGGGGASGGGGR